jgi:DNA-binding transcriptional LysR family regulator
MSATLSQLEAVYWISRLGSFREAARQLGRSQPSISQRINELERNFGERIFNRTGNKVQITPAGAKVVAYAEKFLALKEELNAEVSGGKLATKRIRLGAVDSFAIVCLPALLEQANDFLPDTHIEVVVDYVANLRTALNERKLDIAFLVDPDPRPFLSCEFLCNINEVWLSAGNKRWSKKNYSPMDLSGEPIFVLPPPAFARAHEWFAAGGTQPGRVSVCNSLSITAHLIASGVGIGILPRGVVRHELKTGLLKSIPVSPKLRPALLYMAYVDQRRFEFQKLLDAARTVTAARAHFL